jgi:hypothetical protein
MRTQDSGDGSTPHLALGPTSGLVGSLGWR